MSTDPVNYCVSLNLPVLLARNEALVSASKRHADLLWLSSVFCHRLSSMKSQPQHWDDLEESRPDLEGTDLRFSTLSLPMLTHAVGAANHWPAPTRTSRSQAVSQNLTQNSELVMSFHHFTS